jgi:hypothetical protein
MSWNLEFGSGCAIIHQMAEVRNVRTLRTYNLTGRLVHQIHGKAVRVPCDFHPIAVHRDSSWVPVTYY